MEGAQLNYTIEVNITLNPVSNLSNLTLTDIYPDQIIFLSGEPTPLAGTNNTFILGNFTDNATVLVNISVLVQNGTGGATINNTANISYYNVNETAFTLDVNESTTVNSTVQINESNLSVTKADNPDPAENGTQLNYTITVTSNGNGTAHNVSVVDTYPSQLIFDSASPTPLAGTNNTFVLGNMTNGTTIVINVTLNVTDFVVNGTVINNTVVTTFNNETGATLTSNATESTTLRNGTGTPPAAPAPSQGGGGGGGGGGVSRIRTMTGETMTITLTVREKVAFVINNADHTMILLSVSTDKAKVRVTSTPQEFTLNKNDTIEVDVNGDGIKDFLIHLKDTSYGRATFYLEKIYSCFESWSCGDWTACENGKQTRECVDLRACGTTNLKPHESQTCEIAAPEIPEPVEEPPEEAPEPTGMTVPPKEEKTSGMGMDTLFFVLVALALIGLSWYGYNQYKQGQKHGHHKK